MAHWKRGRDATRATKIIHAQEALALTLLNRVKEEKTPIDMQLDVFEKVGKWVSIKNRLEDEGDSRIGDFKSRILGQSEADSGAGGPGVVPRKAANATPYLDAIKSRLSSSSDGGADGNSGGGRGKVPASA